MTTASIPPTLPDLSQSPTIDQVGVHARVARLQTRSIKKSAKIDALKMVLRMIDLTPFATLSRPLLLRPARGGEPELTSIEVIAIEA